MTAEDRPSKRDAFMAFLAEGWVSIHLDARRPEVDVPDEFRSNGHLVLQYGRNMPIPIPDLQVGEDGIRATLSFSRLPHQTIIPWSSVYIVACTDGRGVLYFEDVPEDVSLMARPVEGRVGDRTGDPLAPGAGATHRGRARGGRERRGGPPARAHPQVGPGRPGARPHGRTSRPGRPARGPRPP